MPTRPQRSCSCTLPPHCRHRLAAAAAPTALRLAWPSCRQFKGYYRNAIRSGFVSHCDEDDPEILQRIHKQARLDADWLVNKVGGWVGGCLPLDVMVCLSA
jgi:hypothetical protein